VADGEANVAITVTGEPGTAWLVLALTVKVTVVLATVTFAFAEAPRKLESPE
jgi:hypothetical protein